MEDLTMREKDVIRLLQYYQHDVKNELQVIHGYLSMGKIDRVKDKIDEWINFFHQEQKLLLLNAPQFILWVVQFNHTYDQLHLTYIIQTNKDLQSIDEMLAKTCARIVQIFKDIHLNSDVVSEISLKITECSDDEIEVNLFVHSTNEKEFHSFKHELLQIPHMTVEQDQDGILCQSSYVIS